MSKFTSHLKTLAGGFAVCALLVTSACTSGRETMAQDTSTEVAYENTSNIPGAFNTTSLEVREEKERMITVLDDRLYVVDMKIEQVEDRAKSVSGTAKQEYARVVDQMDKERERLVEEYQKVNNATNEEWEEVKNEVEEVIREVEQNVNELAARLDR